MKRIITYFIVGSLLMGCTPKSGNLKKILTPSTVDQQENPLKQVNESKASSIKKLDESKDWVMIEKTETLELYTEEQQKPFREMLEVMVLTTGDAFENWYNTNYTPFPEMTLFKINIDTEEINKINDTIATLYDEKTEAVGHQTLSFRQFVNDEVLSVVIHEGGFIPGSDFKRNIIIYNISMKDGHILNNSELLALNNLTIDDVKNQSLDFYLEHQGTIPCDEVQTSDNQYCYRNPTRVNEMDSYFFMEDNHLIYMGYINIRKNGESIKIQIN